MKAVASVFVDVRFADKLFEHAAAQVRDLPQLVDVLDNGDRTKKEAKSVFRATESFVEYR